MSYAEATGAQRRAVNTAAMKLATGTEASRHGFNPTGVSNDAPVEVLMSDMQAALDAVGAGASDTQMTVSDGQAVSGVAVTGTGTTATFTVAGGVITGIVLS